MPSILCSRAIAIISALTPAFAVAKVPRPGAGWTDDPAVTVTMRPRDRAPSRYGCASIARSAGMAKLYALSV